MGVKWKDQIVTCEGCFKEISRPTVYRPYLCQSCSYVSDPYRDIDKIEANEKPDCREDLYYRGHLLVPGDE